jgi:hypothetical protein
MRLARIAAIGVALAVAGPAVADDTKSDPASSSSSSSSASAKKRKKAAAAKKRKAAAAKKKQAAARKKRKRARIAASRRREREDRDRRPTKGTGANMPAGWSWPPTPVMIAAGEACTKKLDELGIVWKKADAEGRIVTPITLESLELGGLKLVSVYRKPPYTMDCHLALGLATYGPKLVALGVRELHFSSIYRNTKVRVNGQTKSMLSRHALGLAIDVRSFIDEAGREAVVETDYNAADTLLLSVEQAVNDSGGFRTVLTPRNDPTSHYDHFHLEIKVEYPDAAEPEKPAI